MAAIAACGPPTVVMPGAAYTAGSTPANSGCSASSSSSSSTLSSTIAMPPSSSSDSIDSPSPISRERAQATRRVSSRVSPPPA